MGLGAVAGWAKQRRVDVILIRPDAPPALPEDLGLPVILLGGPFSVLHAPAWLAREQAWIRTLIERRIPVFSVCFGARLLALALGSTVEALHPPVAGWTPMALRTGERLHALRWHDERLQLAPGIRMDGASSDGKTLAFSAGEAHVGVEFHPEWDADTVSRLSFYFGSDCQMLRRPETADSHRHNAANAWLGHRLDRWFGHARNQLAQARRAPR